MKKQKRKTEKCIENEFLNTRNEYILIVYGIFYFVNVYSKHIHSHTHIHIEYIQYKERKKNNIQCDEFI